MLESRFEWVIELSTALGVAFAPTGNCWTTWPVHVISHVSSDKPGVCSDLSYT